MFNTAGIITMIASCPLMPGPIYQNLLKLFRQHSQGIIQNFMVFIYSILIVVIRCQLTFCISLHEAFTVPKHGDLTKLLRKMKRMLCLLIML